MVSFLGYSTLSPQGGSTELPLAYSQKWWAPPDLNREPIDYEPIALTIELGAQT